MKKLVLLTAILTLGVFADAQTSTVTATAITDSDSTVWANGTVTVSFYPNPAQPNPGSYSLCAGGALSPSVLNQGPISLGSGGSFSLTVYNNSLVCPAGSQWQFTICPNASSKCGTLVLPISGGTVNITSAINSAIPVVRFPAVSGQYGYADVEAIVSIPVGGQYWNVSQTCQRFDTGSNTWICGAGGGGSLPLGCIGSTVGGAGFIICTGGVSAPDIFGDVINVAQLTPPVLCDGSNQYAAITAAAASCGSGKKLYFPSCVTAGQTFMRIYSSSTQYSLNQAVMYEGLLFNYINATPSTGNTPPLPGNPSIYWAPDYRFASSTDLYGVTRNLISLPDGCEVVGEPGLSSVAMGFLTGNGAKVTDMTFGVNTLGSDVEINNNYLNTAAANDVEISGNYFYNATNPAIQINAAPNNTTNSREYIHGNFAIDSNYLLYAVRTNHDTIDKNYFNETISNGYSTAIEINAGSWNKITKNDIHGNGNMFDGVLFLARNDLNQAIAKPWNNSNVIENNDIDGCFNECISFDVDGNNAQSNAVRAADAISSKTFSGGFYTINTTVQGVTTNLSASTAVTVSGTAAPFTHTITLVSSVTLSQFQGISLEIPGYLGTTSNPVTCTTTAAVSTNVVICTTAIAPTGPIAAVVGSGGTGYVNGVTCGITEQGQNGGDFTGGTVVITASGGVLTGISSIVSAGTLYYPGGPTYITGCAGTGGTLSITAISPPSAAACSAMSPQCAILVGFPMFYGVGDWMVMTSGNCQACMWPIQSQSVTGIGLGSSGTGISPNEEQWAALSNNDKYLIATPFMNNSIKNNTVDITLPGTYGIGIHGLGYNNTIDGNHCLGNNAVLSIIADRITGQCSSIQSVNGLSNSNSALTAYPQGGVTVPTGGRYAPSENNTIIADTVMGGQNQLVYYNYNSGVAPDFVSRGNKFNGRVLNGASFAVTSNVPRFPAFVYELNSSVVDPTATTPSVPCGMTNEGQLSSTPTGAGADISYRCQANGTASLTGLTLTPGTIGGAGYITATGASLSPFPSVLRLGTVCVISSVSNSAFNVTSPGVQIQLSNVSSSTGLYQNFQYPSTVVASPVTDGVCAYVTYGWVAAGTGSVSTVSVVTANGVSGTVANPTTTPAITLTLGAITPTSTNGVSAATMAFLDATSSVQTQLNAKAPIASPTFTGTLTASQITFSGCSTAGVATTTIAGIIGCSNAPTIAVTNMTGTGVFNTSGQAGNVANALTLNNSNSGAASGSTYNGAATITASANTFGAGSLANANTWSAANTFSAAGALSTAGVTISGVPVTGGSTSTTFPQMYLNSGSAVSSFSTNGTVLGINAPSGFTGNLIDLHTNGGITMFRVGATGVGVFAAGVSATSFTDSGLTTGNCVQAGTAGLLGNAGGACAIAPGTEAFGIATLAAGTVTVSNAAACTPSATCVYTVTNCGLNGTTAIGVPGVGATSAGVSFVINSYTAIAGVAVDTSKVCWRIN